MTKEEIKKKIYDSEEWIKYNSRIILENEKKIQKSQSRSNIMKFLFDANLYQQKLGILNTYHQEMNELLKKRIQELKNCLILFDI